MFDLKEADTLLAEAARRDLWFGLNFNHRYARPVQLVKAAIEAGELGNPPTNVGAVGVELSTLGGWVEDPEVGGGVGAGAGDPLPVAGVLRDVGVDQVMAEETFASAPVDEEVLDQEAGADHSDAVVHPPGLGQLAHAGVHDGITGATGAPPFEAVGVVSPGNVVILRFERDVG